MSFDESKKIISSLAAPHEYQSKNNINSNIINTKTNYYFQIFKREKIVCFFRKFIFIRLLFIIHLYFRLLHYNVFKSSRHFVRHSNSNIKYNLILFVMTLINRMDILTASTKVLLPPSTSITKEVPENLFLYDNTTNHNYTSTMPSLIFVRLLNESAISSAVRTRKDEDDNNNNNNNLLQQSSYIISSNFGIPSISPPTYNGSSNAADTQLPYSPFSPFIIVDAKNNGGSDTRGLLIDSIHETGGKSKKSSTTHLPLQTAEENSSNITYIKVKTAPQKAKFYETTNFQELNSTNPSSPSTLVLLPEDVGHENVETSTTWNTHFLSTDTITYNYYYYLKSKLVTNSPTLTARPPPAPLVKTIEDFIDIDYFDYIEPDDWFLNIPPLQATTAASATKIPSDLNIIMPFNTSNYYVTTTNTIKTTAVFATSIKNIPPPPKQQNQAPPKAQNYLSWVQHQKSHNTRKNLTSSSPLIKNNVTPTMDHHNKTRKNLSIHKLVIGALINVSSTDDVVTTTTTTLIKSPSQKPTFMLHNHCSNRHVQIFGRRINAKASQFTRQRYKYANLYAEASDTAGQIRLRSARTGYYVCFDKQARLLARLRPNKSLCDFVEIYHNRFFKYRSVYVPVWYMGFDLTGHPLPGITHDAKDESNDKCYYFIKRRNIQKYHVLELNSSKPETLHLGKDERDYQKDEILSFSQLLPTAPKIFKTSLFSKLFGVPHRLNLVKSKNKKDEEKSTPPFKRKKQLTRRNETETFNLNSASKHLYNDLADGEESSSADEDTYKSLFDYFSPPRTSHNKRVHSDDYPDNYNKFSTKNARVKSSTTPNNKNNSLLLKWQFQKHHQQPETHRTIHQSTASDEDNNIFENYFNSPIKKRISQQPFFLIESNNNR